MTRDTQIAHYRVLAAEYLAAQHAEISARRAMDNAATALSRLLLADVPADAVGRTIVYQDEECMVVGKRCSAWDCTKVRPLVARKIAKGKAWGKTHAVANKAFWDFEAGDWKVEG